MTKVDKSTGEILHEPHFYRGHNNYDTKAASEATQYIETMESLTIQSQMEDADINVMMKRFGVTGVMPQGIRTPEYGDFSGINDYQTALNAVMDAQAEFNQVPAELRARFDHNPQKFLEYCADPKNLKEMRELGLAKPEVVDKIQQVRVIPEPVTATTEVKK